MIEQLLEAGGKGAIAGFVGVIGYIILYIIKKTQTKKITIKKTPSQSKSGNSRIKENGIAIDENGLYEQIWKEIEEKKTDLGLWAKCFAKCEGDENKTKALYVNERIFVLKEDLQKQLIV